MSFRCLLTAFFVAPSFETLKQKNQLETVDGNARWAVFCSSITFAATAIVVHRAVGVALCAIQNVLERRIVAGVG